MASRNNLNTTQMKTKFKIKDSIPEGDIVKIPITVQNFNNMGSFQFRITYDTNVLEYGGIVGSDAPSTEPEFGTTVVGTHGFHGNAAHHIAQKAINISAFKKALAGITLAFDTVIYTLTFRMLKPETTIVKFEGSSHLRLAAWNALAAEVEAEFVGGSVIADSSAPAYITENVNEILAAEVKGVGAAIAPRITEKFNIAYK